MLGPRRHRKRRLAGRTLFLARLSDLALRAPAEPARGLHLVARALPADAWLGGGRARRRGALVPRDLGAPADRAPGPELVPGLDVAARRERVRPDHPRRRCGGRGAAVPDARPGRFPGWADRLGADRSLGAPLRHRPRPAAPQRPGLPRRHARSTPGSSRRRSWGSGSSSSRSRAGRSCSSPTGRSASSAPWPNGSSTERFAARAP